MPETVDLCVVIGVGVCGWTISIKEVWEGSASLKLNNNALSLDSTADERTGFRMFLLVRMVPLLGGILLCG